MCSSNKEIDEWIYDKKLSITVMEREEQSLDDQVFDKLLGVGERVSELGL